MPRDSSKRLAGVDETEHAILDQVADVDGVRHRGGDTASKLLDEGYAGGDSGGVCGGVRAHQ
jgi:hypothetical protein